MRLDYFRGISWMCLLLTALGCSDHSRDEAGRPKASDGFSNPQVVALATAAENGDVAAIDRLVSAGVDVNTVGREGMTPLLWTLFHQNKRGFQRLLEHGATPNIQTKRGDSVIRSAAGFARDSEYLELALKHGGDPNLLPSNNTIDPKATPLFDAINEHHTKGVKLLIDAGASLNHKDSENQTPLEFAIRFHHFDIVYELLTAGADYQVKSSLGKDIVSEIRDISVADWGKSPFWYNKVIEFIEKDMEKKRSEKAAPTQFDKPG